MSFAFAKRPLVILFLLFIIVIIVTAAMFDIHHSGSADIFINGHDLSNTFLGWLIAIPILIGVGVLLIVVLAGLGAFLLTLIVIALSVILFALLLAFTPLLLILSIPALFFYGLYKLINPATH